MPGLLGDDLSLLARQRDAATNGLAIMAETQAGLGFRELLDRFNEQWVAASRFLSPALVIGLLRITGEWSASFYTATDPESLGEPVGLFDERRASPYRQIVGREYVERWVHHHQIRRALGEADLGVDFLRPACEVIVRAPSPRRCPHSGRPPAVGSCSTWSRWAAGRSCERPTDGR